MSILPLIALRDLVAFPGIFVPIFLGRDVSVKALEESKNYGTKEHILLVTQKNEKLDSPSPKDLYKVGVLARIVQIIKLPNENIKIIVEPQDRVKLSNISDDEGYFIANYDVYPDKPISDQKALDEILLLLKSKFIEYSKNTKKLGNELIYSIDEKYSADYLVNLILSHSKSKIKVKQEILKNNSLYKRILLVNEIISYETQIDETDRIIQARVKKQMEKIQRDYYLNEKMKSIQEELSDSNKEKGELSTLEKKIKKTKLSKEAQEKAESELKKLKMMNPVSAESSIVRNYLDTLLSMPWEVFDKSKLDIKEAQKVLDRDHYGLEKVKNRIIEYLAVLQRSNKIQGPILCFVGPPGVGKTSLVKSIAESLGRKYSKFSLGGVRDEAEIRGHRRTYLGSMPGKILTLIKKAKTSNPVILLDEIDKMNMDYRGDPASALLEVLDPEQNSKFSDHYLEVEYDISNVIFITTANSLNIPTALRDRMEIIRISGYIEDEKLSIAKNYLIPKQLKAHSMNDSELHITDDALLEIIRYYTSESGVRNLEREIGTIARKILKIILTDNTIKSINVDIGDLEKYLGVPKYRHSVAEEEDQIGATTGLAYTEVGGELLTIESVAVPGKGEIKGTGKLGDVMKESAQAAYSYFRSNITKYGVDEANSLKYDIHFHVPEGAVPKDGPSAGIAIFTTITSLMTGIPVKKSVAMTGEITLRGKVLAIGGLKEKLLAAVRGGIKTVIIPKDNERDLKEIPDNLKNNINIIPVSDANEVLKLALSRQIELHNP
jgi:ATP-dependent Lon protease